MIVMHTKDKQPLRVGMSGRRRQFGDVEAWSLFSEVLKAPVANRILFMRKKAATCLVLDFFSLTGDMSHGPESNRYQTPNLSY